MRQNPQVRGLGRNPLMLALLCVVMIASSSMGVYRAFHLIDAARRMLCLSETPAGRVHDKRLADTAPYPLPAGSQLRQDVGFQALTRDGVEIMQPTQKPRGQELTRAQKAGQRIEVALNIYAHVLPSMQ